MRPCRTPSVSWPPAELPAKGYSYFSAPWSSCLLVTGDGWPEGQIHLEKSKIIHGWWSRLNDCCCKWQSAATTPLEPRVRGSAVRWNSAWVGPMRQTLGGHALGLRPWMPFNTHGVENCSDSRRTRWWRCQAAEGTTLPIVILSLQMLLELRHLCPSGRQAMKWPSLRMINRWRKHWLQRAWWFDFLIRSKCLKSFIHTSITQLPHNLEKEGIAE